MGGGRGGVDLGEMSVYEIAIAPSYALDHSSGEAERTKRGIERRDRREMQADCMKREHTRCGLD